MMLNEQEESLINVVRSLSPEEAGKVLNWAHQLADLAQGRPIQWSDAWSDEDLADATAAAMRRFEEQELKTVETGRCRRGCVSWRASNENTARSGPLHRAIPLA
jgi:hypothetical protein